MLNGDVIKLADFGWSNYVLEERNTFCGTLEYVSPEIILKKHYDEKVDIWAVGVLLYELTHGHSPFYPVDIKISNQDELFERIKDNILKVKYRLKEDLSQNIKELIRKLLSENPEERPRAQ